MLMDNMIARLTPPGKAAIATLAIQGPDVLSVLRTLFRAAAGKSPAFVPGQFIFGKLGASDTAADEVVLAIRQTEPTPRAEFHCHGGSEVVRFIEALFQ